MSRVKKSLNLFRRKLKGSKVKFDFLEKNSVPNDTLDKVVKWVK